MPSIPKMLHAAAIAAGLSIAFAASAEAPPDLDARVAEAMRATGVPGMAVAIVEQGKVVHAKGYGVSRLGSPEPVDADTIFPTGSTGKAVTTAALAVLVDEGKIGWDDKVIDHLPGFQMYDPWVTREMTIRDLLVHRSGLGLGAGDLMFVPRSSLSRAETVRRLRYIKPATSFRSGYAYDNLLYVVAGQLIEEVSGRTWEAFVRERVLKPAGMSASTTEDAAYFATANRVQPHARMDGGFRGIGNQEVLDERKGLGRNAAPAGGISSSAADMGRWLAIQLARGALPDGKRLFSEDASRQMWLPQVLVPIAPYPAPIAEATPQFSAYALGWSVRDYRGAKIIEHGGAVFGVQTMVVLVPDRQVGFSLQINSEDGVLLRGLMFELLDHYLDAPKRDWVADFAAFKKARDAKMLAAAGGGDAQKKPSRPSLPLAGYAGNYADPWYGPIVIRHENGRLRIDFKQTPDMAGTLEHRQYDTFRTRWDDPSIEPADVTFALDAQGKVDRITMKASSPLADFSYDYHDLLFTPQRDE
ncbi:serine hydrolase [Luteimonas sp. SX5]|uniref:Serine hydrolase n=1 Tax=Luteimonas galliterrae TaxID=2940486 RepID=A0ABT0MLE1_9GAMM|nr:serine hydrolase [Luteimonas galliterrae]MCL1635702.1 serine hydrolase [Luteimonas galliterrae]